MNSFIKKAAFLFFNLCVLFSYAQLEHHVWVFGRNAGVDFTGGAPVPFYTSVMGNGTEGTASMADAAGNLLFYAHGETVWNANHVQMNNGANLDGSRSATHIAAVKQPGANNNYYLFTADWWTTSTFNPHQGIKYHVIDMNQAGGLGVVTTKNVQVLNPASEKIAMVYHANGTDIWIIVHGLGNNNFHAYLLTAAGLAATPVISSVGSVHPQESGAETGCIKVSPNCDKVAVAVGDIDGNNSTLDGFFELFDFDNAIGLLSNPINLSGGYKGPYGVCFSPDQTKLYGTTNTNGTILYQFDITSGNQATIAASRVQIHSGSSGPAGMNIGPDGIIYGAIFSNDFLATINNPNAAGLACNFVLSSLDLQGPSTNNQSWLNLPTFVQKCETSMTVTTDGTDPDCYGESSGTLVATPVGGTPGFTYDWQPGNHTDSLVTGVAAGTYTVTVTDTDNNTATGTVTIAEPDSLYLDPLADVFICPGETASFTASANGGTPNYNFLWNGSVAGASISGSPTADTTYYVQVTDDNGCTDATSVNIIISPSVVATVSPDTSLCAGGSVTLSSSGGSTYEWSPSTSLDDDASATPVASPTTATTYTVIVRAGSCDPDTQTVFVDVTNLVALASGNVVICNGDSIGLSASGGTSYQWLGANIDDATSSTPNVWPSTTTTYSVIVSDTGCTDDTAVVTVSVVPDITANISPDTAICEGESVTLTASGGSAYSWSPAASLSDSVGASVVATPATTTSYAVTVTSGSCAPASNSVNITVHPLPTVSLGQDTSIETGESISLSAPSGGSYTWSPSEGLDDPSSANPVASPTATTTYILTYTDANGCTASDEITITVSDECGGDGGLFIPSAFTPNGDGMNDEFKVRYIPDCVEIISFVVYDRWGEKVFEANSNVGWDGIYRNNYLNSAVFDYYLEALLFDGEKIVKSGSVSLIR